MEGGVSPSASGILEVFQSQSKLSLCTVEAEACRKHCLCPEAAPLLSGIGCGDACVSPCMKRPEGNLQSCCLEAVCVIFFEMEPLIGFQLVTCARLV